MKSQRIELRASPQFVKQLDDLAHVMRCPVSRVVRQLVLAEYKRRFPSVTQAPQPNAAAVASTGEAAKPTSTVEVSRTVVTMSPSERAAAAHRMLHEMGGFTDAELAATFGGPLR